MLMAAPSVMGCFGGVPAQVPALTIVVVARAHCGQGILPLMIGGALHAGLDEQKASMDGRAPSHWTVVPAGTGIAAENAPVSVSTATGALETTAPPRNVIRTTTGSLFMKGGLLMQPKAVPVTLICQGLREPGATSAI